MAYSADSFACLEAASGAEWPGVDGGVMALIAGLECWKWSTRRRSAWSDCSTEYGLLNVMQCKV